LGHTHWTFPKFGWSCAIEDLTMILSSRNKLDLSSKNALDSYAQHDRYGAQSLRGIGLVPKAYPGGSDRWKTRGAKMRLTPEEEVIFTELSLVHDAEILDQLRKAIESSSNPREYHEAMELVRDSGDQLRRYVQFKLNNGISFHNWLFQTLNDPNARGTELYKLAEAYDEVIQSRKKQKKMHGTLSGDDEIRTNRTLNQLFERILLIMKYGTA
jgi:hypothetical protein